MATNTNDTNGPIQQLELLLQSGETIEQEEFDTNVAAALKGRLGSFYQLYLFAITFVHTTPLIPGSLLFSGFESAFQTEGMHTYRYALSSQGKDEYGITTTKFPVPRSRETVAYMLDVLHNVEHLVSFFPLEESFYDPVTHQQLHLLCQNNGCIGLGGEPRPVLTVFRIILAAELFQRYLPAYVNHREGLLYKTVKWWWLNGEFHENYPDFTDSSAMAADDYPGVFGKLLRRLGHTHPGGNPQSRVEPCLIYPYLIRQRQIEPWTSRLPPSKNDPRHHRGPSAMGDIETLRSNVLEAILEESPNSSGRNQPGSTNILSVPEVSTSPEPSEKSQTEDVPPPGEASPDGYARPTGTSAVPDSIAESTTDPAADDTGVGLPAVSNTREAREETVNSENQIGTNSVSNRLPAIEEAPIPREDDSGDSMPASGIPKAPDQLKKSFHSDTSNITGTCLKASGDAHPPSQQPHQDGHKRLPDTPSRYRSGNARLPHQVIEESAVACPITGSSPELQRGQEGPSEPPNKPQAMCAATELEGFSNNAGRPESISATTVQQASSLRPIRRSGRPRREPERYDPELRRQRRVAIDERVGKRPTTKGRKRDQNNRRRKNVRKSAVTKESATKGQRQPVNGALARHQKPTIALRPLADVPALEVLSVSARGRLRKVPQKYGV